MLMGGLALMGGWVNMGGLALMGGWVAILVDGWVSPDGWLGGDYG